MFPCSLKNQQRGKSCEWQTANLQQWHRYHPQLVKGNYIKGKYIGESETCHLSKVFPSMRRVQRTSWFRSQSTGFIHTEGTNISNKHSTNPPTYLHRNAYHSPVGSSATTQTSVRTAALASCRDLLTEDQKMKSEFSRASKSHVIIATSLFAFPLKDTAQLLQPLDFRQ